jgi:hypothetical protein
VSAAEVPIVRELIETEAAAGFSRLRRVPSSKVRGFVDYYDELSAADAAALRAALADRGALLLAPPRRGLAADLAPAYKRWTNALRSPPFSTDLRYQPLRDAKMMVGAGLVEEGSLDADGARELAGIKNATAALLRG